MVSKNGLQLRSRASVSVSRPVGCGAYDGTGWCATRGHGTRRQLGPSGHSTLWNIEFTQQRPWPAKTCPLTTM
jgi:hypothetical protein